MSKEQLLILANINTARSQLSKYADFECVQSTLNFINNRIDKQSVEDFIYGVHEDLSFLSNMIEREAKDKEFWQFDYEENDFRLNDYSLEAIECVELAQTNLEKLIYLKIWKREKKMQFLQN